MILIKICDGSITPTNDPISIITKIPIQFGGHGRLVHLQYEVLKLIAEFNKPNGPITP